MKVVLCYDSSEDTPASRKLRVVLHAIEKPTALAVARLNVSRFVDDHLPLVSLPRSHCVVVEFYHPKEGTHLRHQEAALGLPHPHLVVSFQTQVENEGTTSVGNHFSEHDVVFHPPLVVHESSPSLTDCDKHRVKVSKHRLELHLVCWGLSTVVLSSEIFKG